MRTESKISLLHSLPCSVLVTQPFAPLPASSLHNTGPGDRLALGRLISQVGCAHCIYQHGLSQIRGSKFERVWQASQDLHSQKSIKCLTTLL